MQPLVPQQAQGTSCKQAVAVAEACVLQQVPMQPAVLAPGACAGCCGAEALRNELASAKKHSASLEATVRCALGQTCCTHTTTLLGATFKHVGKRAWLVCLLVAAH